MTDNNVKQVCLLDMDTTPYRGKWGYVFIDLTVSLHSKSLLDFKGELEAHILGMLANYKDRTIFAAALMQLYCNGTKNQGSEDILAGIKEFWREAEGNPRGMGIM